MAQESNSIVISQVLRLATRLFDRGLVEAYLEIHLQDGGACICAAKMLQGGFRQIDSLLIADMDIQRISEVELRGMWIDAISGENDDDGQG